jgi:hypothetical protein
MLNFINIDERLAVVNSGGAPGPGSWRRDGPAAASAGESGALGADGHHGPFGILILINIDHE